MSGDERRVRVVVSGRVQGVGFRHFTRIEARRCGLSGWVRNRPDGRVELEAQGAETALERFLVALRRGPRWGRVDEIDLRWQENLDDSLRGFDVRF